MLAASTAALVAADVAAAFSLDFLMWGWDEVSEIVVLNDFEALEDRQNPRGLAYFRAHEFNRSFWISFVFGVAFGPDFSWMNADFIRDPCLNLG